MSARKSEFKKKFSDTRQSEYLQLRYGAQSDSVMESLDFLFRQSDWEELQADPELPELVSKVREYESQVRELRIRLEALQHDDAAPHCEHCKKTFYARAGAKFCSTRCRVAAHRHTTR